MIKPPRTSFLARLLGVTDGSTTAFGVPPLGGVTCLLVALAAAFATGCSKQPAPAADVVAQVGPRQLRADDLRKEVERRQLARRPIPDKETLLNELVTHEALLQRARSAGLHEDPQIQREISNLLIGKLRERELASRLQAISVTGEEITREYQRALAKYTRPAKVQLALLYLEANPKGSDAQRAEVRDRLAEARRKFLELAEPRSGFGPLATSYSDDQASRYRGGDIGWLESGTFGHRWPRAVLEAGYALDEGQVSEVIEGTNGFYLVMKTDSREASVTPLGQVESSIRQTLLSKKRSDIEQAFRQESLQMAGTVIHSAALKAVHLPDRQLASRQRVESSPAVGLDDSLTSSE